MRESRNVCFPKYQQFNELERKEKYLSLGNCKLDLEILSNGMDYIMFIIVFTMMIIAQIIIIFIVHPPKYTVLAGDVSKSHLFFDFTNRKEKVIDCGGELVDVSDKVSMIVKGNSMKKYNIHDGQTVYLGLIPESEVTKIKNHPVLVIKNKHRFLLGCRYKLRKFVCYVDSLDGLDLESLYDNNSKFIGMKKDLFCKRLSIKISRIKDRNGLFILSETFKENIGMADYSLHHAKYIYACAEYVV